MDVSEYASDVLTGGGETYDRDDDMGIFGRLLKLVELCDGTDDGLQAQLVSEALSLLRGADV